MSQAADILTTRRSILAGLAALAPVGAAAAAPVALAALPPAGAPSGDAVLLDAWRRLEATHEANEAFAVRQKTVIDDVFRAADAVLPLPDDLASWPEDEGREFMQKRHEAISAAWEAHPDDSAWKEQDRLFDEVIWPLCELVRETVPTTLTGAAIKAAVLLEWEATHEVRNGKGDLGKVNELLEQLASLAPDASAQA
jgi:hypothetical protein